MLRYGSRSKPTTCNVQPGCISAVPRPLGRWGALGVPVGSKVSPSGQGRKATDTTSVAFASSSRNTLLPFLALLNSKVIPWRLGSVPTVIQQWGPSHNSGRPTPAMPQSDYGPTFWELPPPGASYLLLPDRHGTPKAKRDPATPTCASSQGEQVILLCLSFSKCLVRGTKKSLSHALGSLIFFPTVFDLEGREEARGCFCHAY